MQVKIMEKLKSSLPQLVRYKQEIKFRGYYPLRYYLDCVRMRTDHGSGAQISVEKIALVSDLEAPSSEQQFDPFKIYRSELTERLGIATIHMRLKDFRGSLKSALSGFTVVILKLSFRTEAAEAYFISQKFREAVGNRILIYFDGDDDICVQWPEIMQFFDLYVKKHVFRDRQQYLRKYTGKSNLHDFAFMKHSHTITSREYGNPGDRPVMIENSGPVPSEQLHKIFCGTDLATDNPIYRLFQSQVISELPIKKTTDVSFRGSVTKGTIIHVLRGGVEPILRQLEDRYKVILPTLRVEREEYYKEMLSSRICVSPFGYGEVCYRDYEAVSCQCLLIKPEMDHLESIPNIFEANKTYVPVKWNFSDLIEKCEYYLNHEDQRMQITQNAFNRLKEFYEQKGFLLNFSRLLDAARAESLRAARQTS